MKAFKLYHRVAEPPPRVADALVNNPQIAEIFPKECIKLDVRGRHN
jgi:hypothetical protein